MMNDLIHPTHFDAVVIGGGHAGCEAAHALARMGIETLLLTTTFALRALGDAVRVVASALGRGDIATARDGIRALCSRDPSALPDEPVGSPSQISTELLAKYAGGGWASCP